MSSIWLLRFDIVSILITYVETLCFILFQKLDYVIYEARRQGIRLILSLVNNLNAFGGKAQYVMWAQANGENVSNSTDSFFSHPTIKRYYKNYLKVCWLSSTQHLEQFISNSSSARTFVVCALNMYR
jgi:endo-1,4-beta-mannosidase